jgi:glycosyltransferase involved in cell wall biosynthesis
MVLPNHITVCVCTFKRAELLTRLLEAINTQKTNGLFTFSAVVADNDAGRSAEAVVTKFSSTLQTPLTYCVEPRQNIALVRNRALEYADGEYIAFIDDDEIPEPTWLLCLFTACSGSAAAGVLGPVKPYFQADPPRWVLKGRFFERPNYKSGYQLSWAECRTGNVLFRRSLLDGIDTPFRAEFDTAGEDMDFYRRMIDRGHVFVWCREAVVHELVPPARCRRSFLLKRALLRGSNFPKHPASRLKNVLKSMIAVPSYTLALPILAVCGHHLFVRYLVKLCDHASRLLAFAGWSLVTDRET